MSLPGPIGNHNDDVHGGVAVIEAGVDYLPDKLAEISLEPTFITAYVSPFSDIDKVGKTIRNRFPDAAIAICSTAGELHSCDGRLYYPTGSYWERVVVQCFDSSIILGAEVVSLPLDCEDLRNNKVTIGLQDRIDRLKARIQNIRIDMVVDHRDTLAYLMFDGLSKSESFFMEALYESGCFPCLFVGGSAGGKTDFRNTWLHDGHKKYENHVLISFLKVAPGARFGIMKSQNFSPTNISFSILSASVEQRYVSQVIDKSGRIKSFVAALCDTFECNPDELQEAISGFSFAIPLGDQLFIRSVSGIDTDMDLVRFYCDISPGEELILVRREDVRACTQKDFASFMEGKPGVPVAGILNDCILRRVLNQEKLPAMGDVLKGSALAGYSTFGEILGLYLNQTLTGVFFFKVPEGGAFKDDFVDNFALHYGEFKAFFLRRKIAKLRGLSQIVVRQIDDFKRNEYGSRLDSTGMDPTMMTVFDGLNDLGQTLSKADARRRLKTSEIERQLRDSEEIFRLLSESSLAGIYLIQDGRFSYVNGAFARMFGYEVEEIQNKMSLTEMVLPEDRQKVEENIRKRMTGEKLSVRYTFRGARKNGSVFHVEVHGRRIKYRGKAGVIGTLIDITEQKLAEARLRTSEERYRALYNENPSMFFTVNRHGIISAVNDFAAQQLGYTKEELVGNYMINLCHHDDRDEVQAGIAQSLKTPGQTHYWQSRKIHRDGHLMWTEEFVRSITGPDGREDILIVSQDISKRKQLEESLKLTRFIFDEASVGIFLMADDNKLLDVNKWGCSSLGYTKEELCNLSIFDFDALYTEDRLSDLKAKLDAVKSTTIETVHKRKDGKIFPVQIFISSLPDSEQTMRVAFVQDMTEWKQAKKEQERLEKQLKQVQKLEAIGRLAGGVAHDLNNLLTPILGYADLLSIDENINESARQKLEQVSKAATGAKDLVKQLLAFSRKQVLEYQPTDINSVLDDFESLIRRTARENIDISISKAEVMSQVMADQGQLEQVILNLVVNASDAMPDGGKLTIKTDVVHLDRSYVRSHPDVIPGRYALLEIGDTGEGMDEDTLSKIFEPFFTTKGDLGTGLGLATVYGIVAQHKGSVAVRSEPGKGTTFQVYLPVSEVAAEQIETMQKRQLQAYGTETILLVEDNQAVRTTIFDILREKGYHVITAESGEDAMKIVSETVVQIDLLVTDVVMPGMHGKELFAEMSRHFSPLKVLFISGYTDDVIVQHGVMTEHVHYLQKPFSSRAILQKIREILDS